MVSQSLSTTFSKVANISFRKPSLRSSFQICSIEFISGVYGGISKSSMFSGIWSDFDLCQIAPSQHNRIMSSGYCFDSSSRNTFMHTVLQDGRIKKHDSPVSGSTFRFIDSAKASFILKHSPNFFLIVENFLQLCDSGVNFFEVSMTSSLALFGCRLRVFQCPQLSGKSNLIRSPAYDRLAYLGFFLRYKNPSPSKRPPLFTSSAASPFPYLYFIIPCPFFLFLLSEIIIQPIKYYLFLL